MAVRYRAGMHRETGKILVGWPHCEQSIGEILTTIPGERVMRLGFGCDVIGTIGRNLTAPVVLDLYRKIVTALADPRYGEPEFGLRQAQLVEVGRAGRLALRLWGDYFPEGRLGNFTIVEPRSTTAPLFTAAVGATA
jgi:phage baseplate assembly protein W